MKPALLSLLSSSLLLAFPALAADGTAVAPQPSGEVAVTTTPSAAMTKTTKAKLTAAVLKPLKAKERRRSRFSRAPMPPSERRVRVISQSVDDAGKTFVTFAVDSRYGKNDDWNEGTIEGCRYPKSGRIFVSFGDTYRPARVLLGKPGDEAAVGTCTPAPPAPTEAAPQIAQQIPRG